jgi:hypothetical protein
MSLFVGQLASCPALWCFQQPQAACLLRTRCPSWGWATWATWGVPAQNVSPLPLTPQHSNTSAPRTACMADLALTLLPSLLTPTGLLR